MIPSPGWAALCAAEALALLAGGFIYARERRRKERERRRAEEKYRDLFEHVHEGVFISTPQGRFLDFNDAFLRLTGYPSREQLMAVDIAGALYVHAEDRQRYQQIMRERGGVEGFEFQMRCYRGEVKTVVETSFATRDARSAVVSHQGFLQDVTERKRAQELLVQSEKMSAMGQMISGVAHELNNPLTAILGYSQLLSGSGDVSSRGQAYVEKLYQQARRTHRIVQNLLSFARQHPPERVPVCLADVLDDTLSLREYDLKVHNIEVHRDWPPELPEPLGDAHRLQQVFLNILNNSVDAILEKSPGGEIWVSAREAENAVRIEITDSGSGVENPLRVFDPFYTTKEVGKGTGLGLSICYGIVRDHGGEITVANKPPRGASFTVTLPVTTVPESTKEVQAGGEVAANPEVNCILVVDDEDAVLDLEVELLRSVARHVLVARNGREAREFMERREVDLLITDLTMPGDISGADLYAWATQHRPELASRVLFTTSDAGAAEPQRLATQSGCACIQKPFEVGEFLRAVRQALGQKVATAAAS